jgi:hypothetical protein
VIKAIDDTLEWLKPPATPGLRVQIPRIAALPVSVPILKIPPGIDANPDAGPLDPPPDRPADDTAG